MKLNEEQKKFVEAKESKILLMAGAGAGKTASIVEKTKRIVDEGTPAEKVIVLTFTNMATDELRKRLEGYPVGIYTIHSYCNYLLLAGGYDTSDLINEEKFDRLFNLIKKHPECAKEVDFLLLDEGHDTDKNQFDFIFDIVKPKNWCIVADIKQTIYEWRGAYPRYIIDLIEEPDVAIYNLSYNYRCKKTILNFAKRLISKLGYDYEDNSIAVNTGGKVYEADYSLNAVAQVIHTDGNYKDWFVLTRSNSEIEQLGLLFDKARIPYATFKQGDITLEQLNEELKKDQVLVLTVHSAKGLERPKVAAVGMAPWWNKKEEETRVNYVAATRAKDLLIWMPAAPRKKKQTMNWE